MDGPLALVGARVPVLELAKSALRGRPRSGERPLVRDGGRQPIRAVQVGRRHDDARPPARPARSTENGRSVGTGRLPRGVSSWLAQPRAPDDGLVCATRSQLAPSVELARTLRRSRESVETIIEGRLSHGISESSSTTGNAPTKFVALDRYIWWRLSRSTCEKRGCDLQPDQRLVPRPGPARAHGHHPIPEGGVTMSRQIVGGLHVGRPHVRIERGMGDRAMTAPRP